MPLCHALVLGPLREHPGRSALAVVAIALGVALGIAVHLINAAAQSEFDVAARRLAGEADLVVRGTRAGFDDGLYSRIARLPAVAAANPAVEADVPLAGRTEALHILGFDPLRAADVQPGMLPERASTVLELFDADAVVLSAPAARWLGIGVGDELQVVVGTAVVALRVVALLPEGAYRQRLGIMDVAAAQWRLARLGKLNRIDLRLRPGVSVADFRREVQALLPAGVHVAPPDADSGRAGALTRAYRLNLDMLALVALFTGAFLVFSSQSLALLRRRSQHALLRALGVTPRALGTWLALEGVALGAMGAALGLALGSGLASYALATIGADLGAGYFRAIAASVRPDPVAFALFFMLGTAFAALGSAVPAWEAAHSPPATALRAGDAEEALAPLGSPRRGFIAMAGGLVLAAAPPVDGLPVAGYAAIALVLLGAVLVMPWLASACLARLPQPAAAIPALAFGQLKATPRQAAIGAAAIVTSVSLMISMLIMVSSFRGSLENWLERMLPADLYLRAARGGDTTFLTPQEQDRVAATPGLSRVQFLRSQSLLLDPARPPVVLLAGPADAARVLPVVGRTVTPGPADPPPAWASEIAADLHGWRPGDRVTLPIAGGAVAFTVAGIWRDYVRQSGAIAIDRALYVRLTGDRLANDAAIWLAAGTAPAQAESALRARLPGNAAVEIASTRELRARSLAIFDRTFAITYALEIAAVLIGLFGVSVSFGAQALARRREFGVLRHLGMTRREVAALLACDGALVAGLGVAFGAATGWIVSLILIHVVNRQSFRWSMDLHVPWLAIAALAALVVGAAVVTAAWSGRAAMSDDVVRAVREDW
ncbi:MAG: ABC transporter permease [Burkholderiales bacterium]|nr:ABC transporter permease [Burkholderiales bacterium]